MYNSSAPSAIITTTWSGDLDRFKLLRASLKKSSLAKLPHHIVVQTEDMPLFKRFSNEDCVILHTSDEILPSDVERRRKNARTNCNRFNKSIVRIAGSMSRIFGWPKWPRYTGWHTQQLIKLALTKKLDFARVLILDSDVIVTPNANFDNFASNEDVPCFATWNQVSALKGKVNNWVTSSAKINDVNISEDANVNTYFDTPFILDRKIVCDMLSFFEKKNGNTWWEVLLSYPPRRWSEFGLYKFFLQYHSQQTVKWIEPSFSHYIYHIPDGDALVEEVAKLYHSPEKHFICIHSQNKNSDQRNLSRVQQQLHDTLLK